MKSRTMALLAVAIASASVLAEGKIGDKAPRLAISEWVKGKPVDPTAADGKHVYVIEFWATWCPPCRRSIPHLTEMQKKYKDKNVVIVGVSTEPAATVRKFVDKQGAKMDYVVAVDDEGKTSKAYMDAYGQRGIPHAFIVDQKGRIIWHDHPMGGIEEVLDKVIAGKFDVADAKALIEQRQREQARMMKAFTLMKKYFELAAEAGNEQEAAKVGAQVYDLAKDNPGLMNRLAWDILTKKGLAVRDHKLALKAAVAANEATKGQDASILDTYALALYENGQRELAVKVQEKAVKLARESKSDPAMIADLEERLTRFRKGD